MKFNTSPDVEFKLRGGDSQEVANYNRVAAINRINYLVQQQVPEFDIRTKSPKWIMCMELEVYKKYYVGDEKRKIDEDQIQRMVEVCKAYEESGNEPKLDVKEFNESVKNAGLKPLDVNDEPPIPPEISK